MPTLSTNALGMVAADLRLDLPFPLETRPLGATAAERAEARRQAEEELRDAELLDHTGHVAAKLDRWLRVLARPDVSVDSAFLPALGVTPVRAVVARAGGSTVLATQRDDNIVRLRTVPRDQLIQVIVEMLPAASRGTEPSLSVPVVDEDADPYASGSALAEDRQALVRLTALPRRRGGQLAVNSVSDTQGRRRTPVLSWFDNDYGRYFAQQHDARDGQRWVTIAPADTAILCRRLAEMVTSITPARR